MSTYGSTVQHFLFFQSSFFFNVIWLNIFSIFNRAFLCNRKSHLDVYLGFGNSLHKAAAVMSVFYTFFITLMLLQHSLLSWIYKQRVPTLYFSTTLCLQFNLIVISKACMYVRDEETRILCLLEEINKVSRLKNVLMVDLSIITCDLKLHIFHKCIKNKFILFIELSIFSCWE